MEVGPKLSKDPAGGMGIRGAWGQGEFGEGQSKSPQATVC